jgi:hypothetical protein
MSDHSPVAELIADFAWAGAPFSAEAITEDSRHPAGAPSLNLPAILRRHPAPSTGAFAAAGATRGVAASAERESLGRGEMRDMAEVQS